MINDFGFLRVAAARNVTVPAGIKKNCESIISLMHESSDRGCDICVFPELSISSYNCGELFRQSLLLNAVYKALTEIRSVSADLKGVFIVGFPLEDKGLLFNCAAAVSNGKILGIVPKTYIPGNNEYYEGRWFTSGHKIRIKSVVLEGNTIPFGTDLLFSNSHRKNEIFGIEICEDLWAPVPPGSLLSLNGASVIFNLSASTEILGKSSYRKNLVRHQSASSIGSYVYSSSGVGESTTDTVCSGHSLIYENGKLMAENSRFTRGTSLIYADIDLEYINHERLNNTTYSQSSIIYSMEKEYRTVFYTAERTLNRLLKRKIDAHPFIPSNTDDLADRCSEIFSIQSTGLSTRLENSKINSAVIGLSGGLDSTLALLVTIESFRSLSLDLSNIHCITMPGFGTTKRTKSNVEKLCLEMELSLEEINITDASLQHFRDIGHDKDIHDTTYENTQARERTQILMDKANQYNAIVIGTGDLSELALGWCTYNGDHMSMYSVNSSVPKTLVKFLIEYYSKFVAAGETSEILKDIIETPISPELLPPDANGEIVQKTEETIGPYELHDFFLFNAVRCGFSPVKVRYLAGIAFEGKYSLEELSGWLKVFYSRFFSQQFKRSAIPDGPKVGTLSLSPRGDWRMPSDADPSDWLLDWDSDRH